MFGQQGAAGLEREGGAFPGDMARAVAGGVLAQTGEIIGAGTGRRALAAALRRDGQRQAGRGRVGVHQARHIRLPITPGAQQAERVARLHCQARQPLPAAHQRRQPQRGSRSLARRHIGGDTGLAAAQPDRRALNIFLIHQQQFKRCDVSGKNRFGAQRAQDQMHLIAERVEHCHQPG